MTLEEMVQDVQQELTFSKGLPFQLNETEIKRVIRIAEKFFYDNWRYATEQKYMLLPIELFNAPIFSKSRMIKMPECVQFVTGLRELKHGSVFGTIDRDFSDMKFLGSEMFLTPFVGDSLVYRTVMFSFIDLTKQFTIETIAYGYNKNTKCLDIHGRNPKFDVVAIVEKKIDACYLYEDELYQRYVRAKAKMRLAEQLQVFNFNLPGDVTLNIQNLGDKAKDEMEKVEAMLKGENNMNFIIIDRN